MRAYDPSRPRPAVAHGADLDAGLCAECRWSRTVTTARGSTFLRCGRAERDPTFAKYPRLPLLACRGFEAGVDPPGEGPGEGAEVE